MPQVTVSFPSFDPAAWLALKYHEAQVFRLSSEFEAYVRAVQEQLTLGLRQQPVFRLLYRQGELPLSGFGEVPPQTTHLDTETYVRSDFMRSTYVFPDNELDNFKLRVAARQFCTRQMEKLCGN
jgi:hypothetical protein